MLQILLVDDEPSVRNGMKKLIDWESLGFILEDTAGSGTEACALEETRSYDLIITDLKMPGMNGLALIRKLVEKGYKGQFMILSAYGEFEYARQAMAYGVRYYLLKPVNEQVLIRYLCEIRDSLEKKTEQEKTEADPHDAARQVMDYTEAHYRESLSLQTVADQLNFNPSYLGRIFKRNTGVFYNEYLNSIRIEKAKRLLLFGKERVCDIASRVGYQDESYFNRIFKRLEGITPTEYRDRAARRASAKPAP